MGLDERAFVAPALLDAMVCAEMIVAVETQLQGNWTTSRHYSVPATDVPVYQVPVVARWFNAQLAATIYPMLGEQFAVAAESIRIIDAFVVRYSADKQRSLPLHCDQSQFSLTIALNSRDEYTGGGTFFADTGEAANADAGGVISFDGSLMHSVREITERVQCRACELTCACLTCCRATRSPRVRATSWWLSCTLMSLRLSLLTSMTTATQALVPTATPSGSLLSWKTTQPDGGLRVCSSRNSSALYHIEPVARRVLHRFNTDHTDSSFQQALVSVALGAVRLDLCVRACDRSKRRLLPAGARQAGCLAAWARVQRAELVQRRVASFCLG
jgi:hypothetical protein